MLKLKNSGYLTKYRTEILDSALVAYEKMVEADKDGTKPLFRDRNWNREQRNDEKMNRRLNWYKSEKNGIEYKSILFVPVTKGGTLAKELKKREEEINKNSKERIKIVEGGGTKMKDILIVKNPFPSTTCEKKKCLLCSNISNKVKIPCNSNNVGYRLVCDTCEDRGVEKVYKGETARSARIRGAEYLSNFPCGRDHKDEDMKFRMEITNKFRDPLTRQANEAVRISSRNPKEVLNSKNKFNHPPITRITVDRNKKQKSNILPTPAQPSL